MAITDLTIIRRSLTSRLFSTVTTALTVAVAVGLLLVLLAMQESGRRAFTRGTGNAHLLISRDSSPMASVLNSIFYVNPPAAAISWQEYQALREAYPFAYAIPTALGDSFRGSPVMATERAFFELFEPVVGERFEAAEGRFFEGPFEVVAGSRAAARFGLGVGDVIFFTHGASDADDPGIVRRADEEEHEHGHEAGEDHEDEHGHESGEDHEDEHGRHVHDEYEFEIVGILAPTASPHDQALFVDLTSTWILHAHDRREAEMAGEIGLTTEADLEPRDRQITGVYARTLSDAVLPQVFSELRADPAWTVASPSDQVMRLFRIVSNVNQLLVAIAAVVMVSSGVAILLALYNSMEQRRRQIAVLRVLGASKGRIFSLVLAESAALGLLGAALGTALAFGGLYVVSELMAARLGLPITPVIDSGWILIVAASAILLSMLAGLAPAASAYRTSVVRNLRPLG